MDLNCERAMSLIIPATRAATAKILKREYKMSQSDIARRLGIAQGMVSRYVRGNYSPKIRKLESIVVKRGLERPVVSAAVSKRDVSVQLDRLASDRRIVASAIKLVG